jgi:Na+/melibiose symporter-like transporter
MGVRNVSHTTLTSLVPLPHERARFLSFQSAVQHLASALAAFLSTALLTELPDQRLSGMPRVAGVNLALTAMLPFMFRAVERRVRGREADPKRPVAVP